MPIVAILTGLTSARAAEVGRALVDAGVTILEVPLRGQGEGEALKAIFELAIAVGDRALVGAGTVLTVEQVRRVKAAGAKLIVSPNLDEAVVKATKEAGMVSLPGVYTPTECLQAVALGADGLKLFPTDGTSPRMLKAMLAVLPSEVPVLAVGGVDAKMVGTWWAAGARGFGVGSSLWKPSMTTEQVSALAVELVGAVEAARKPKEAASKPPAAVAGTPGAGPPMGWLALVSAVAAVSAAAGMLVGMRMAKS